MFLKKNFSNFIMKSFNMNFEYKRINELTVKNYQLKINRNSKI